MFSKRASKELNNDPNSLNKISKKISQISLKNIAVNNNNNTLQNSSINLNQLNSKLITKNVDIYEFLTNINEANKTLESISIIVNSRDSLSNLNYENELKIDNSELNENIDDEIDNDKNLDEVEKTIKKNIKNAQNDYVLLENLEYLYDEDNNDLLNDYLLLDKFIQENNINNINDLKNLDYLQILKNIQQDLKELGIDNTEEEIFNDIKNIDFPISREEYLTILDNHERNIISYEEDLQKYRNNKNNKTDNVEINELENKIKNLKSHDYLYKNNELLNLYKNIYEYIKNNNINNYEDIKDKKILEDLSIYMPYELMQFDILNTPYGNFIDIKNNFKDLPKSKEDYDKELKKYEQDLEKIKSNQDEKPNLNLQTDNEKLDNLNNELALTNEKIENLQKYNYIYNIPNYKKLREQINIYLTNKDEKTRDQTNKKKDSFNYIKKALRDKINEDDLEDEFFEKINNLPMSKEEYSNNIQELVKIKQDIIKNINIIDTKMNLKSDKDTLIKKNKEISDKAAKLEKKLIDETKKIKGSYDLVSKEPIINIMYKFNSQMNKILLIFKSKIKPNLKVIDKKDIQDSLYDMDILNKNFKDIYTEINSKYQNVFGIEKFGIHKKADQFLETWASNFNKISAEIISNLKSYSNISGGLLMSSFSRSRMNVVNKYLL